MKFTVKRSMSIFAIVVTGSEQKNAAGTVVGAEDDRYWVVSQREGWVPATSAPYNVPATSAPYNVPADVKKFSTEKAARNFARSWDGHPWWCTPKSFDIVELRERYELVLVGYEVAT